MTLGLGPLRSGLALAVCSRLPGLAGPSQVSAGARRALSSYSRRPIGRPFPPSSPSASTPRLSSPPLGPSPLSCSQPLGLGARRTFFTAIYDVVGASPLPGLLAASPLPLWGSIAVLALTVRGGITFPLQLWQRRRTWRTRKHVIPEMRRINNQLAAELVPVARRKGLSHSDYVALLKSELADRQAALHKKHNTHPTITMLVPLAVSIPLFIVMSMTIRQAVTLYPDLAEQSFAWIKAMGEPDQRWILPLVAGMLGLVNAEYVEGQVKVARELSVASAVPSDADVGAVEPKAEKAASTKTRPASASPSPRQNPSSTQRRRLSTTAPMLAEKEDKQDTAETKKTIRRGPRYSNLPRVRAQIHTPKAFEKAPKSPTEADMIDEKTWLAKMIPQNRGWVAQAMAYALKGGSFIIIIVGLQMPAAVVWYWACSMTFTLVQNRYFNRLDVKEKAELETLKAAEETK